MTAGGSGPSPDSTHLASNVGNFAAGGPSGTVDNADRRFDCFDGLRAIAALLVVFFHVARAFRPSWISTEGWRWVDRLGPFGVCIFFLISGFLLYRPFAESTLAGTTMPRLIPFWIRRFFRIFPAYWLVLTVASIGFGVVTVGSIKNAVTYYGLLQNYREGLTFAGLSVAWTLVIEVSFYALLPFIAMGLRAVSRDHDPDRRYRKLMVALGVLYVAGLVARYAIHQSVTTLPPPTGKWLAPDQAIASILAFMDWFALGMLLAVGSLFTKTLQRPTSGPARFLGNHPGIAWAVAFAAYVVAARLDIAPGELTPVSGLESVALSVALGIAALFLIVPAVFDVHSHGVIRGFLRARVMVFLGTIAYGIYLWHVPFKNLVVRWTKHGTIPDRFAVQLLVVLALTIATAAISYYALERPIIGWSRRISRRRSRGH